jgi:hypothetical protein
MSAANAIASGAAILTANADGLHAGLKRAEADIYGWGSRVNNTLNKGGGFGAQLHKSIGSAGQQLGKGGMLGGLGGAAASLGPYVAAAGAAAAAVGVLGKEVADTLGDLGRMDAIAKAMGMTAEQFTGVAGVAKSAGEDTREFIESLVTLGKLGTDAAAGTPVAAQAFRDLGLSAGQFVKMRPDEQFFQLFDSLQKVQDPLKRTRLLMNAFGEDGGKYLLPLLSKAPEEIRAMAKSFAISNEEMQKAAAGNQAVKSLTATADMMWKRFAIAAAPAVKLLADFASKGLSIVQPVFDLYAAGVSRVWRGVSGFFEGVQSLAGRLWGRLQPRVQPVFDWLEKAWDTTKRVADIAWQGIQELVVPVIEEIITWVEKGIDQVAEWATEVFGFTAQWPGAEETVVKAFRAMGTAGAYAFDTLKAGAGYVLIGVGKIIQGVAPLADLFKGVFKGIADMGADAARALGLADVERQFREVGEAADRIAGRIGDAGKALESSGRGMVDSFGKSPEQFNKWLDKMLQPKKAAEEVMNQLNEGIQASEAKLSGALLRGSKDAYSLVVKNQLRQYGPTNSATDKLVKQGEKADRQRREGNKQLGAIQHALDGLGVI